MTLTWWCKDWGKTDTWLQKWLFCVLMQALATPKACTLMCYFCQYVWVKKVQGICVITLKNDAKFEEEPTCIRTMTWGV